MVSAIDRLMLIIEINTKVAEGSLKKVTTILKGVQKVLLGMGMAFLFTGMAIARATQNALRGLLQTFLMIEGETGPVNNTVNNLLASWEYLRWSLITSAIETGVFDKWIDRIERLIGWFGNLRGSSKAWIVDMLIYSAILGTAMMVIGMALLFILGPVALLEFLLGSIVFGILSTMIVFLWNVAGIITRFIITSVINLIGWLGGVLLYVWATVGPLLIIVGLFLLIIALVVLFRDKIELAGAAIALALVKAFKTVFNFVIENVNKLIGLINDKLGRFGISISTISGFDTGDDLVSRLESRFAEMKKASDDKGGFKDRVSNVVNNINVEGSIGDESIVDKIFDKLEDKMGFGQGSPQT